MTAPDGHLSGLDCALVHGGMNAIAKNETMASFAKGKYRVLMATTVIEVGINVPDARVIVVQGGSIGRQQGGGGGRERERGEEEWSNGVGCWVDGVFGRSNG